jgi:hypothetical protein
MTGDLGPSGKAKGGHARAEKLTPEQRSSIASDAAKKRWEGREIPSDIPRALPEFRGELDLGGVKLPCAVIQGPNGIQRVLTESGIANALLGTRSGASKRLKKAASEGGALLPLFVAPGQLKPFIDKEMMDGPLTPIDSPPFVTSGFGPGKRGPCKISSWAKHKRLSFFFGP